MGSCVLATCTHGRSGRARPGGGTPPILLLIVLFWGFAAGSGGCGGPPLDADGRPITLGRVRLRTYPKGAQVWIDGQLEVVHTPATLVLSEGPHHLKIQAPGAAAIERKLYVRAGTSRDLDLRIPAPPDARIHVFSDIVGADVRINGYRRGATPLIGAVTKPGPVDITVTAGREARSRQTSLVIGEQKTIEVFFGAGPHPLGPGVCPIEPKVCRPAPKGFLTLGMKPDGRVEFADGRSVGATPIVRHALEPGTYELVLRSDDGQYVRPVKLRIEAGKTAVFRFQLTKADRTRTSTSP